MKQHDKENHFQFKKFTVSHEHSTMKVGTDAVLLGAWCRIGEASSILEIGTGSGVIALMLAQRTPEDVVIDAVEIEKSEVQQAQRNIQHSPWPHKIRLHHTPIQHYEPGIQYDCIVTNPPYFINSQRPPDQKRHQARHTITLTQSELIGSTIRLLHDEGSLNVVLPYTEGLGFCELATQSGLYCSRQFSFRTRKEKPIERLLMEFRKSPSSVEEGEILLYSEGDEWSAGYQDLTRPFYIKI